MNFTFGIITNNGEYLNTIIESIYNLNIPKDKYEIFIVGSCNIKYSENIKLIPFDETIKPMWITKKKNLITINSTKENIIFLHDYVSFDREWYNGFLNFGNDWDVCSNVQLNPDGGRFRDWVLHECNFDDFELKGNGRIIPYDNESGNYVYINGTYFVAKRNVMIEAPLDENRIWAENEDLAFTKYIKYKRYKIKINTNSICHLLKHKDVVFNLMDEEFYRTKFRPFIKNKDRNQIHFENNMSRYERECSLLKNYLQEDLSEKYIKRFLK